MKKKTANKSLHLPAIPMRYIAVGELWLLAMKARKKCMYLSKALYKAFLLLISLSIGYAQTEVSGLINSNTTWDSTGSPYIVVGNIAVMNATLMIGPGVEVKFNQDLNMRILTGGELIAQGQEIANIIFTKDDGASSWDGIYFEEGFIGSTLLNDTTYIQGSTINNCTFSFSNRMAINSTSTVIETLFVANSTFDNNYRGIIYYGDLLSLNNSFSSNGGGIICYGNLFVYNNTFNQTSTSYAIIGYKRIEVNNSVFNNNFGGIKYSTIDFSTLDTVFVSNSIFNNNSHNNLRGGAICAQFYQSSVVRPSIVIIENCSFTNNSVIVSSSYTKGQGGGAVFGSGKFVNCTFDNNSINNTSVQRAGGGAVNGTGIFINCSFTNNSAYRGSAIYCEFNYTYGPEMFQSCNFDSNIGSLPIVMLRSALFDSCYFYNHQGTLISGGGDIIVKNSTITNNSRIYSGSNFTLNNSIVNNNSQSYLISCQKVNSKNTKFIGNSGRIFLASDSLNLEDNIFYNNYFYSTANSMLYGPYGTIKNCIFTGNYGNTSGSALVEGNNSFNQNNIYNNSVDFIVKLGQGIQSYDYTYNFWGTKDSIYIQDSLIYDFYDDPSFNTSFATFKPFLFSGSDSINGSPLSISQITLAQDATFDENLSDSVYVSSTLNIQLAAVDINSYCPDLTTVYIINLSSQDTVFVTLVESGDSTGIFRSTAEVHSSTDNVNDMIGANIGDQIKIVSKTDTTKYYSFIVAQTPPPNISNLDIGDSDDIFHILNSTPGVSWSYSDPLSSPQIKYNIQVGLDTNWTIAEMWDTGEISSSDNFSVYSGSTLHEDSTYFIRVRVNNGTFWSSWIDTSFGLNSYPQMVLIDTSVAEDDTLLINLNDFISDSDDPDSLLNVSSNGSGNIVVNINADDHQASFIPTENWNGIEKIGFICTDPWGFQTVDSLALTVLPINDAPIVTTAEFTDAIEDQEFSFTIEATDADIIYGDSLAYSLSIYPVGMTIDVIIGEINWMPDNNDVGDTTITIIVTDDSSATDSKTFSLLVRNTNDSPFIANSLQDIVVNEDADSTVIDLNGVFDDDDIDVAGDSLVFNVSNDNASLITTTLEGFTLTLSYLADQNGIANIVVTAIDDSSASVADTILVTVNPVNDPPYLVNSLGSVAIDEDDFAAIVIPRLQDYFSDVDSTDHLSFSGLALDVGLDSLSIGSGGAMVFAQRYGLGHISPELSSQKFAVLSVKRSQVKMKQNKSFIGVKKPEKTFNPEIRTGADVNNTNSSLSSQTQADTTALIVYPTLNFNGDIRIVVTATDDSSAQVSDTLFLTVMPINDLPVLTALTDTSVLEDDTLQLALLAYDLDGDTLIFSAESDTNALNTIVTDTVLMLIPNVNWNGVTEITVGVTDNDTTVTEQFTLTVLPVNDAPNPFILLSPIDSTIIQITQDNLNITLFIEWESSFDVDGDTVFYNLIATEGISFITTDWIQESELKWTFAELVELMDSIDVVSGTWSIIAADNDTTVEASNGPFTLTIDATSLNIDDDEFIPQVFALHQNYPNPFNPVTTIRYDVPKQSHVVITIYDILGRHIRIIVNEIEDPGFKSVVWDGKNQFGHNISSGIYFYQIAAKSDYDIFVHTRKLVLLR